LEQFHWDGHLLPFDLYEEEETEQHLRALRPHLLDTTLAVYSTDDSVSGITNLTNYDHDRGVGAGGLPVRCARHSSVGSAGGRGGHLVRDRVGCGGGHRLVSLLRAEPSGEVVVELGEAPGGVDRDPAPTRSAESSWRPAHCSVI